MELKGGGPPGRDQATLPQGEMAAVWREACKVYREVRREGSGDHPAWKAARLKIMELQPELTEKEAGVEASRAVHYCSTWHPQWLWNGVGGWEWPPQKGG
jgi:hypothetical protein